VVGLARRGLRERAGRVLLGLCAVATVLALAAGTVFVAGPVRYGPPPGELPHVRR
jgi:hypothetical protein